MSDNNNIDIAGATSLGSDINKQKDDGTLETKEGVVSEKLPELKLKMSDEKIVKLTTAWEKLWKESPVRTKWEREIEENEKYWLGEQFDLPKIDSQPQRRRATVDNMIFESLETYLPQVTRRNPEPMIKLESGEDDNEENQKYVLKLKTRLGELADLNKIRLKLKRVSRHWAIYHLGVVKLGWDLDRDIPVSRVIRPKRMILDPKATIDEDGYGGNRIGEHRKLSKDMILAIIGDDASKDAKAELKKLADKQEGGTEIQFIEWWTPQFMCWKLNKVILLKKKNPHWNYDGEALGEEDVDTFGNETTGEPTDVKGINHFTVPKMPYEFLSVYNLGEQPMDKTGLIHQNLSNQDRINKRSKQIDKNADKMNGGAVISLERSGLTQGQAKAVNDAIRKGGSVVIPAGAPQDAIYFPDIKGLPADVYNDLLDTRARLRDIFGTRGSSPAGLDTEKTVRGKIINRTLDTDRIGGGVSEYLEQLADDVYNWYVQLLYVYDDDYQFIEGVIPPKVNISVIEGSLLPKDSTTIANQAIELAGAGKMSTVDMYKRLEYPNPEEMAANNWLEINAPHILFKDNPLVQEAIELLAQNAQNEAQTEEQKEEESHRRDLEKEDKKAENKAKEKKESGSTPKKAPIKPAS